MGKIDVSIVIVCMNNLKNLYPCLDSIRRHTTVSYETLVVAYLFSKENLEKVLHDYPWITLIESNEIRGFSENNNLALKQSVGEYLLISNDDIEFKDDVIGKLLNSFKDTPEASIVSPMLLNTDGSVQNCGKARYSISDYMLHVSGIRHFSSKNRGSRYCFQKGIFQTYNISGAFFMIKKNVMERLGGFDERYFFCPEDLALSTKANKLGYKVFVDENISVFHHHGRTSSMVSTATTPAMEKGNILFFSNNMILKRGLEIFVAFVYCLKYFAAFLRRNKIKVTACRNTLMCIFSSKSPKEIFIYYYGKMY